MSLCSSSLSLTVRKETRCLTKLITPDQLPSMSFSLLLLQQLGEKIGRELEHGKESLSSDAVE